MQGTEPALHICGGDAVAESAGVVSLEVISHFSFDLNAGMDVEGGATAEANVVAGRTGIREAKIFSEDSTSA